jgi:hypothetical protein
MAVWLGEATTVFPEEACCTKVLEEVHRFDAGPIGGTDRYPVVAISDENANTAFVKD